MAGVALHQVSKRFGQAAAVDRVDIEIADGELCVVVGPSGCGKSTILRLIAGLEEVSAGSILIGGRDVTRLPPARRGVAMVFQSYALYPHMTVAENITFGLRTIGADRARIEQQLRRAAAMLQLEALLDRKPGQLSGGERQRVAIGRAIVREPAVFLLDEPLSNLDAGLRAHMRVELQALHRELGVTMIYVTHDQVEAMTMADRIVVINAGRVEQAGAPLELYERPANLFVAGFIGSPRMNLIAARIGRRLGQEVEVVLAGGAALPLPVADGRLEAGMPVTLGIRPEHILIGEAPNALPAVVGVVEHLGAETIVHARAAGETLTVRVAGVSDHRTGDRLQLHLPSAACHLFLPDGSRAAAAGAG